MKANPPVNRALVLGLSVLLLFWTWIFNTEEAASELVVDLGASPRVALLVAAEDEVASNAMVRMSSKVIWQFSPKRFVTFRYFGAELKALTTKVRKKVAPAEVYEELDQLPLDFLEERGRFDFVIVATVIRRKLPLNSNLFVLFVFSQRIQKLVSMRTCEVPKAIKVEDELMGCRLREQYFVNAPHTPSAWVVYQEVMTEYFWTHPDQVEELLQIAKASFSVDRTGLVHAPGTSQWPQIRVPSPPLLGRDADQRVFLTVRERQKEDIEPAEAEVSCSTAEECLNVATAIAKTDLGKAVPFLTKSCLLHDTEACRQLGLHYREGKVVPRSDQKAAAFFESACRAQNARACSNLGIQYEEARAPDLELARTLHRQACDAGSPVGCSNLARIYSEGLGVPPDLDRAKRLYEDLCFMMDYALSCANLGVLFSKGSFGKVDFVMSRELFERACRGGAAFGCYQLGLMYRLGKGVPVNIERARVWLEKACGPQSQDLCLFDSREHG